MIGQSGSTLGRLAQRFTGKRAPAPAKAPPAGFAPGASASPGEPEIVWPISRIAAVESLWGEGFLRPGGTREVARLVKPLGLQPNMSVLVIGSGAGGPTRTLAGGLDLHISTLEQDARLAELATQRFQRHENIAERITALPWEGEVPKIPRTKFDICLAHSVLRGDQPAPFLKQMFEALKFPGQLMLVDLVLGGTLHAHDPDVASWSRLERRPPTLPDEVDIGRGLANLGFDVRVTEDETERQTALAVAAWATVGKAMTESRPPRAFVPHLINEADLWQARIRLLQSGRIRVMRWHCFKTSGNV